jgi:hypothetical protein
MDCLCGCGRTIAREAVDFNFQAGEVGAELLVWDKARATLDPSSPDAGTIDAIVEPGASIYQDALAVLHGEAAAGSLEAGEAWLDSSREARRAMARTRPYIPKGRIKPSDEDFARYDARRPERTFTGARETTATEPAASVGELDHLHRLYRDGALTAAEFAAAKARLISRI